MSLILEDGTIIANSNSYATETMADNYFDDRANTDWANATGDKEGALIRATAALDGMYRYGFPGYRTLGRQQSLEWPRTAAYDYEGIVIDTKTIPIEIIKATCEMAVREVLSPGILRPDLERGGMIRSIRAGSVGIDYGGNNPLTDFTIVTTILSSLLGAIQSPYSAPTARG